MALPTTRNITIAPSDPIPSVLLNALQDSIIGFKHPELIESYHAAAFMPAHGVGNASFNGGIWTTSTTEQFLCAIPYPVGTRITQVSATYRVGVTAGATVSFLLQRRNLATPTAVVDTIANIAADSTDNASGETTVIAAINHTMLSNYAYFLQYQLSSAGSIIYGATVGRDRL
jgi:hypothetical protein